MRFSKMKFFIVLSILVLAVAVIAGCTFQERRIGVIDMNRVIKESPRAQKYQNELDEKGAEIQEKYKFNEDIKEDKNLTEEQKLQKEEERRKRQEAALQEFIKVKKELEQKLNQEIEAAVKEVAKEKRLDIILYKQSVRYGGVDITQDVINKLQ
ncbi:hypothetical protein BBF96_11565 [Anoxybacter fermentans]|uniref:Molecular chaperone Skp n=1 Tax=Anoxybacter fermentans TaxID=1323375 RepID=A0A3S9T0L9_9FIRM|nr:OmpH family outer membrane protein [Anoxybacter fermentans]AZR73972.1 hypothetical protein BBF96_11565 [Anoxybacter fermentans]